MKRILLLITGLMLIGALAACSYDKEKPDNKDSGAKTEVKIDDNYVDTNVILDDIEEGKTFGFVIVDKDCSACQSYKAGALKKFEESHPGELRYIEINGIKEKTEELKNIESLIVDHLDGQFEATPTTYFIVDGKLASVEVGAMDYDQLLSLYKTYIEKE